MPGKSSLLLSTSLPKPIRLPMISKTVLALAKETSFSAISIVSTNRKINRSKRNA